MEKDISELELDLAELRQCSEQVKRENVKKILKADVQKLESEIKHKTEQLNSASNDSEASGDAASEVPPQAEAVEKKPKPEKPTTPRTYTVNITNYGWDQSDKFMKIYVTGLDGVQNIPKENVTSTYTDRSFKLEIKELNGKNHCLHVAKLLEPIAAADSYHKVKTDTVLVMLKKKEIKKTWAYVTEREKSSKERKKPKMDEDKDPSEGLMDLLKQMYEDGDDEMKRMIAKSWSESQQKQNTL